MQRALKRAGHTTRLLDDRRVKRAVGRGATQRWIRARARQFRPDFVVLSKCLALDLETVANVVRGIPSALWYHDAAYWNEAGRADISHVIAAGKLADTFFVTGFEREWRSLGLNAHFLPAAADSAIRPQPPAPAFAAQISFTGTGYDASRAEFLVRLAEHFRVRVWGEHWERWADRLDWSGRPAEGVDFARVCSSSGVMLGILPAVMSSAHNAASDRMWMTLLAGGFYLGRGTPGVECMLADGVHCAWYSDFESCVAQAERYLGDAALRETVRACGEAFVRRYHTYDARIGNLLTGSAWVNPLAMAPLNSERIPTSPQAKRNEAARLERLTPANPE